MKFLYSITIISLLMNLFFMFMCILFARDITWKTGTKYVTITNDYNQGASDMFELFDHKFVRGSANPNSTDFELLSFCLDIRMKSLSNDNADFSFIRKGK
jgi:hypothetical protein